MRVFVNRTEHCRVGCAGPCLTGACDPHTGCVPLPATTVCDDGDPCTVGDHCSGSGDQCVPGPNPCDAPCRTGRCDAAGGCTILPEGAACDDGDPCTVEDRCRADGTCVPGTPVSCDGGDPCTIGTCNGAGKCDFVALQVVGVVNHHVCVSGNAIAVKRRLRQPSLPMVILAFTRQQTTPQHPFCAFQPASFLEMHVVRHEDVFDGVGMIDDVIMLRSDSELSNIAKVPRDIREKRQRVAPKREQVAAGNEAFRARRKSLDHIDNGSIRVSNKLEAT